MPIVAIGILAGVCLVAVGAGVAKLAGDHTGKASGAATAIYRAQGSVPAGALAITQQAQRADVVVRGTIERVDDARWNSKDGLLWNPQESSLDMPVVYTTFYVTPKRIYKGNLKWGSPVAFRILGGALGPDKDAATQSADAPFPELKIGDEVVVFGKDDSVRYGGVFVPEAYWAMWDSHSLLRKGENGEFVNLGGAETPDEEVVATSGLEQLLSGAGATSAAD